MINSIMILNRITHLFCAIYGIKKYTQICDKNKSKIGVQLMDYNKTFFFFFFSKE